VLLRAVAVAVRLCVSDVRVLRCDVSDEASVVSMLAAVGEIVARGGIRGIIYARGGRDPRLSDSWGRGCACVLCLCCCACAAVLVLLCTDILGIIHRA